MSYPERLKILDLTTLESRRLRGDLIEVFKILKGHDNIDRNIFFSQTLEFVGGITPVELTNKYDSGVNLYLEKQQDNITRGHSLKLVNNRYHYDLRKFSFAPRIDNVWNSLPEIVISAATTDTFKRRLDKFWQHQDILYDYKVELTGVGNRSQINTDDNAL